MTAALFTILGTGLAGSISVAQTAFYILLLMALYAVARSRKLPRPVDALDRALVLWFAWGLVAAVLAQTLPVRKALAFQMAFALFFLARHVWREIESERIVRAYLIVCAVLSVWAVFQIWSGIKYNPDDNTYFVPDARASWPAAAVKFMANRNGRAVASRSHPLTFAECLMPAFFILLAMGSRPGRTVRERFLYWGGAAVVLCGTLASGSRAVWLGLLVGLAIAAVLAPRSALSRAVAVGALVALPLLASVPSVRGRFMSIFTARQGTVSDAQSRSVRFQLWSASWTDIKARPFLGDGPSGAELVATDPSTGRPRTWSSAHNIYLQSALDHGAAGFAFLLVSLALLVRRLRRLPDDWRPSVWGGFCAFLIAGLTESWMNDSEVAMLFWFMAGWLARHADRAGEGGHA